MATTATDQNPSEDSAPANPEPEQHKQIYLRTIYPLNPGIPHFVDVPGGW